MRDVGEANLSWAAYIQDDYDFTEFAARSLVLDAGCGSGQQLRGLEGKGCRGIGLDVDGKLLRQCQVPALVQAAVEQIPIKDASLDGVVCKVAIPYAKEGCALDEIGRVLKAGGMGRFCYHGAGYYLRYVLLGPTLRLRFYGLRALINTWVWSILGCRLPGFLGDTTYQPRRRLASHYRRCGLQLVEDVPARTFLCLPVFIYHTVEKRMPCGDGLE